eukprot:scaffold29573_cov72-Skeletonema_dohrnii-CCMP3373.AAC.1
MHSLSFRLAYAPSLPFQLKAHILPWVLKKIAWRGLSYLTVHTYHDDSTAGYEYSSTIRVDCTVTYFQFSKMCNLPLQSEATQMNISSQSSEYRCWHVLMVVANQLPPVMCPAAISDLESG